MKLTDMLKELDIGKWSACWAFITKGWAGIAQLICEAFTKLLRKADQDKLKGYAELTAKAAVFLRGGIETFCTDGAMKDAGMKTADAVSALAEHLADGEYTTAELEQDVNAIGACINAWKEV